MIRDVLLLIAEQYRDASKAPLKAHAVAEFVRQEAPLQIRESIGNDRYVVEGSPGQGNWAEVPWIAVFDPTVTTSATRGYYVVYLFAKDMTAVYLCLGQGTTAVREEFGAQTHEELRRLAALMRARLPEAVGVFADTAIKPDWDSSFGDSSRARPPRLRWVLRPRERGDRGIRGDLAARPQAPLAPCIVARGQSQLGVRFATRVNIPLDPPIPPVWPCSRPRKGCGLSQGWTP